MPNRCVERERSKSLLSQVRSLYDAAVLGHPFRTLLATAAALGFLLAHVGDVELDASADALLLANDPDLRYHRLIRSRYGSDDFLILSFTPRGELLSDATLAELRRLRDALAAVARVDSVVSILDVPLFQSPPVSLFSMGKDYRTLEGEVDRELARRELTQSPLYRESLVSEDGQTTALQINLWREPEYERLLRRQDELRASRYTDGLDDAGEAELAEVTEAIRRANTRILAEERATIEAVRTILHRFEEHGELFLGGIPMIVVDMIAFVRQDLVVFGTGVVLIMGLVLAVLFRQARWVLLPLGISLATALAMMGYLGAIDWRVSVISSNFFSLLLIMTLAIVVHLVVRYRELCAETPDAPQRQLLAETLHSMWRPCFYTAATTMVAFGSLIVSDIRPVIDFGWMMTIGVGFGLVVAFLLFPTVLIAMPPPARSPAASAAPALTAGLARLTEHHGGKLLLITGALVLLALGGVTRLSVENRFTDYFKSSTAIHRGLVAIDQKLGGTTPFEVIVDGLGEAFWDDPVARERAEAIHAYLEALPETGKVLSAATFMRVATELNDGFSLDNFYLNLIYRQMSPGIRARTLDAYVSRDHDQLRFAARVRETDPTLRRQALIEQIGSDLTRGMGLPEADVHITGLLVLYNNMLRSLFRSQILTLGAVFVAIMLMFVFAFRSVKLAVIAILPNVVPALLVLGTMGWLGMPLDMMTITIAAIAVGIGVDNAIHYLHRFQREFARDGDYLATLHRSHRTIGRALFYTSLTVVVGFSILAFSNFIPTIAFGLLTALAMSAALLANLLLLPELLLRLRPLQAARSNRKSPTTVTRNLT